MRIRSIAVSTTVAIAMVMTVITAPASASERDIALLSVLERHSATASTPAQNVLSDLATNQARAGSNTAVSARFGDTMTTVSTDPAVGVSIERLTREGDERITEDQNITIAMPFAAQAKPAAEIAKGVVAYENGNDSSTIPLVKKDGSVQIVTVISSAKAPTGYSYDIGVPDGATIELTEDGGVAILSQNGTFIAGVAPPWAADANGTAVPTRFDISGSVLTQIIEHREDYAYPVVADPWAGKNLLSSASMSFKIGYYVVNAVATSWGRTYNGLATHAAHVAELKQRLGGTYAYVVDTNGGTIREQFLCHVAGNLFEPGVYNMESYQPARHWATQLNLVDQCNILKQAP